MAKRKPLLPDYGTVQIKGKTYFRTRLSDDDGNRISLYAASREELYEKVMEVEKTDRKQDLPEKHPHGKRIL